MIEHEFNGLDSTYLDEGSVFVKVTDEKKVEIHAPNNVILDEDVARELVTWIKGGLDV
jgi:hypothetical protein